MAYAEAERAHGVRTCFPWANTSIPPIPGKFAAAAAGGEFVDFNELLYCIELGSGEEPPVHVHLADNQQLTLSRKLQKRPISLLDIREPPGVGVLGSGACWQQLCLWLKLPSTVEVGGQLGGRCCSRGEGLGHCHLSCILGNGVEMSLRYWETPLGCQAHCQGRCNRSGKPGGG